MKTPEDIVRQYLDLIVKHAFDELPLHPQVRHESPYGVITGRLAFIKACSTIVGGLKEIDLRSLIAKGPKVVVEYDAIQESGTRFLLSEWFTVEDDQITEIKAFFDANQ